MGKNQVDVYPVPEGIAGRTDFRVYVRPAKRAEWEEAVCYEVSVDMHEVRKASMACFDFTGKIEVKICVNVEKYRELYRVDIRPRSRGIIPRFTETEIYFELDNPENLSIEVNGDRFHNLHLFAGKTEEKPEWKNEKTVFLKGDLKRPSVHGGDALNRVLQKMPAGRTVCFGPGIHYIGECIWKLPSDTNIYISGGAAVIGSFVCEGVENVRIYGKGVMHLAGFERYSSLRGVRISQSRNIQVEGIAFINPPHYTIYVGGCQDIAIRNIKSFSCEGWSDGIDIMSSRNVSVQGVFMRNSDDCIAVYGHRWEHYGDTCNVVVEDSVLWADVAHPMNIGCHGDHEKGGDVIRDIRFRNVDVLEHHEPQKTCMGCMCINAGDGNTVRNVRFEQIRVEHMEHGKLLDLQTICGKYNPIPGKLIEDICFKDIYYDGQGEETSEIKGLAGSEVRNVTFDNLVVRGQRISNTEQGNIYVGENIANITFV
ncbi:MAG: hypothetical protein HFH93_08145 [Lachnospiraceae bacterium]|nr:hypothetical protein [Lachnospiraceae bacterium]